MSEEVVLSGEMMSIAVVVDDAEWRSMWSSDPDGPSPIDVDDAED